MVASLPTLCTTVSLIKKKKVNTVLYVIDFGTQLQTAVILAPLMRTLKLQISKPC